MKYRFPVSLFHLYITCRLFDKLIPILSSLHCYAIRIHHVVSKLETTFALMNMFVYNAISPSIISESTRM